MRGMTLRGMCVMGRLLVGILFMMFRGLPMMLGGMLVMICSRLMARYYFLLGHRGVPLLLRATNRPKLQCSPRDFVAQINDKYSSPASCMRPTELAAGFQSRPTG
jgi:hypothetical protein